MQKKTQWELLFEEREDKDLWFRFRGNRNTREIWIQDGVLKAIRKPSGRYERDMADGEFYRECLPIITRSDGKFLPWNIFFTRVAQYCDGMTRDEALDYVKTHADEFGVHSRDWEGMKYGFIVGAKKPEIRRAYGNNKKNTFDFVRLEVLMKSMTPEERNRTFAERKHDIVQYALDVIGNDMKYKEYGVPVSFLKPYSVGVHGSLLFLDFELKGAEKDFRKE